MKEKICPSLQDFTRFAKKGNIVPVYQEMIADTETPISAFMKLNG